MSGLFLDLETVYRRNQRSFARLPLAFKAGAGDEEDVIAFLDRVRFGSLGFLVRGGHGGAL